MDQEKESRKYCKAAGSMDAVTVLCMVLSAVLMTGVVYVSSSDNQALPFVVGCIAFGNTWISFVLHQVLKSLLSMFESEQVVEKDVKKEDEKENDEPESTPVTGLVSASSHEGVMTGQVSQLKPARIHITPTGECFHLPTCEVLRQRHVNISKAYRPCRVCIANSFEISSEAQMHPGPRILC